MDLLEIMYMSVYNKKVAISPFLFFYGLFERGLILEVKEFFNPSNATLSFFRSKHKNAKIFENHLNHVMLVYIG